MVMTVTKKYHVGVSYANEDQDIVKSVVKALESVGLTVFFDQKGSNPACRKKSNLYVTGNL